MTKPDLIFKLEQGAEPWMGEECLHQSLPGQSAHNGQGGQSRSSAADIDWCSFHDFFPSLTPEDSWSCDSDTDILQYLWRSVSLVKAKEMKFYVKINN